MRTPPGHPISPALRRPAANVLAAMAAALMAGLAVAVVGTPASVPATGETEPGADTGGTADAAEPALRSVSTAPVRPTLAPGTPDGDPPSDLAAHHADLLIEEPTSDARSRALEVSGVGAAAAVEVAEVTARHRHGRDSLTVAVADPTDLRAVTPAVTARSEGPWRVLEDGGLALTHEAARELALDVGAQVALGSSLRPRRLEVGATVSLGRAGVADVLVHREARDVLGSDRERVILVGVEDDVDVANAQARLQRLGVGRVRTLPESRPFRAELVGDHAPTVDAFEPFTFEQIGAGRIEIDPEWVAEHIVEVDLPILGSTRCHRLIVPQLQTALAELEARDLDHHLDPDDYGGCWMPRHISWDESRGVSLHAWGIAFDVNVDANPYGAEPTLDRRVVEVFEQHGFNWGGRWSTPDGMHFELGELHPEAAAEATPATRAR